MGILKNKIATIITSCRIILSLFMPVFPVLSARFCVCYLLAGFTDMIDGTIARKLGTDSEFGEKIDTIADVVFVAVHSWANKITGLALFALPFSLYVIDIKYSAIVVCLLATFAAVQEGHIIRTELNE